jgi:hypothetical protein
MPEVVSGGKHCLRGYSRRRPWGGQREGRSLVNGVCGIVFVWYFLFLAVLTMYDRSRADQWIALLKDETKNG